jgi:F-type H+-transporting ATPase subunit b
MLEFEPGLFIWTAVSFGLLVLLLYKVALPPLLDFLAQREKMIADSLAAAAADRQESAALLAEHKKALAEVHHKAEQIINEARVEGRGVRAEIIAKAGQEAERLLVKAQAELGKEKETILREVRESVADLVMLAAGKAVRRLLTAEDDQRIIKESLAEIKR